MSERGLYLALQRLHDDPGFVNLVATDPQNSLGIYDLDETECQALIQAATNRDDATLRDMASKAGIDWTADHVSGTGALSYDDISLESQPARRVAGPTVDDNVPMPQTNRAEDPTHSIGANHDLSQGTHVNTPVKPGGN